ncbi:olfactory receptor 13C3-like [Protopterus annectens]|uniref:olfactory receptor 13C3-like n=1 Tax=Protopterus annectens TaxID=7888 RepID=UPI001CFB0D32|nr:olfactory receptor 13C3-like [Protopterus annectens]
MVDILSESKTITQAGCLIQMYFAYTFGFNEMSFLAVMAYDRYISICNPLRYASLMTKIRVRMLLILPWLYSFCIIMTFILLALRLPLCHKFIANIACDSKTYLKLSCSDVSLNNIYETCISMIHVTTLIVVIVFSYVRIFKVSYRASRGAKSKALNTCMTHLLLLFIYLFSGLLVFFQARMGGVAALDFVQLFVSLVSFMVPPLFNPLIYGIRTHEIRKTIQKAFANKAVHSSSKKI